MAKNYFNRYVWLIDTIRRAGRISLDEISRKWEQSALNDTGEPLPERTFHNHRIAILETFGIEIKSGRNQGYYINNCESESLKQWMLESFSLNNILSEGKSIRNQILFEKIPSGSTFLTDIVEAIKDHHPIELTYQSFHSDTSYTFCSEPYCLKLFKQRWYMLARSEKYGTPRIYALDRAQEVSILSGHTYSLPEDFNAEEFFKDYFGVIIDDELDIETIDIKVVAKQVKYFDSLPLHHTQSVIETTDSHTTYRYRLVPTFDFCQELLSKGAAIEVLSPQWLREEIIYDLEQALNNYK